MENQNGSSTQKKKNVGLPKNFHSKLEVMKKCRPKHYIIQRESHKF